VTGLVVDASGNPVSGAYLSPEEGASVDLLSSTDSNGRYCTWVLAGQSETITATGTAAPYGEGSVTVTAGSTGSPRPGSESCAGLDCATAPNIVLNQTACKTDSDCPSGDTCCAANGTNFCFTSYAREVATTTGATTCTTDSDCPSGDTCCDIKAASRMSCLTQAACNLVNSGGTACGSGSLSATIAGETQTWDCFIAELEGTASSQILAFDATGGAGSTEDLLIAFTT
jgi:hypothetical protein